MTGSVEEQHVQAIVSYLERGSDRGCSRCLGIEIEHFVVDVEAARPVFYEDDPETGKVGVAGILAELSSAYHKAVYNAPFKNQMAKGPARIIGLERPGANVTLEPGAQLEISMGPVLQLSSLEGLYTSFRAELDPILESHGYRLLTLGYQPFANAADIPMIPKQRYHYMDRYFQGTGHHGICMMRGSASTQVSLDYANEPDALRKLRVANALGPILAFLTDNSPVFETLPVGIGHGRLTASGLELPSRMTRTRIWDDVDPTRCMLAPGSMSANFSFRRYAESLMRAGAVFSELAEEFGEHASVYQGTRSAAETYAGRELSREDVEHILSLFFFDNRFKTYIEIRLADSLPIGYALAFCALLGGLFYSSDNLDWLDARLESVSADAVAAAKRSLEADAWDADVYGRSATEWLDALMLRSDEGLDEGERHYLKPLADLVARRSTLFDDLRSAALDGSGGEESFDLRLVLHTEGDDADFGV